jgi:hypothetical protein
MNLDREIEDLLSVDPSPEFVAKVRAGVAAESAPTPWLLGWRLVAAGAACVAVAVAALTMWPLADPPFISEDVAKPAAPVVEVVATVPPPPPPADAAQPEPPRRLSGVARAVESPEVLVSEEEIRSFRLLLAQVQQGRIPEVPKTAPGEGAGEPLGPPWIEISPVVITPIAQLAQPEGERQ